MRLNLWSIIVYFIAIGVVYFSVPSILDTLQLIFSAKYIVLKETDYFMFSLNLIFGFTLGYLLIHTTRGGNGLQVNIYTLVVKGILILLALGLSLLINFVLFSKRRHELGSVIYINDLTTLWIEFPVVTIMIPLIKNIQIGVNEANK